MVLITTGVRQRFDSFSGHSIYRSLIKMITSTCNLINRFIQLVIISAIVSCDSLTEHDSIKPEKQFTFTQSEFYTLPGSSIIIDLNSIVEQSFVTATISISEDPIRGTLSKVDARLLKYRPSRAFQGGEDHFDLSAEHEGKILATKTVTVSMRYSKEEFPCALIVVEDKIKVKSSSLVSIPILNNDWLCAIDKSAVNISIYSDPLFGQGLVDGESITYLSGPDYKGHDEFIYKLTPTSGENATYGIISVTAWTAQTMSLPDSSLTKMVFVDDTTGYLAGNGMYKTIDGGEHWSQILYPQNISGSSVNDIHFLDANNGFAVYSSRDGTEIVNGLATTKDGGASWRLTPINYSPPPIKYSPDISSVFFTSTSTGFISALDWGDYESIILKTEDGGKTWKQLVISNFDGLIYSYLILKYADSRIGYAYQYWNIFITQDGGESWDRYNFYNDFPGASYDDLCMDVIDENTLFAGGSVLGSFTHPTSIFKFELGSTPKIVAVIPYKIWQLEFSPSGNVGFAVGISGTNNQSEPVTGTISINKSIDKGETWTEEYIHEDIEITSYWDFPAAMAVPSENVVYILYANTIIKYSNK